MAKIISVFLYPLFQVRKAFGSVADCWKGQTVQGHFIRGKVELTLWVAFDLVGITRLGSYPAKDDDGIFVVCIHGDLEW